LTSVGVTAENGGVSQGNLLSPILCNIYFHEFDVFIKDNIIKRYKRGTKATMSLEYQNAIKLTKEEKRASQVRLKQILRRKRREAHANGLRYTKVDGKYIRIRYVRYADDFLIGVTGSKDLARKIINGARFFLKSQLQLKVNEEKSRVYDSFSEKVPYLGMFIHNVATKNLPYRNSRAIESYKRKKSRVLTRANALIARRAKNIRDCVIHEFRKAAGKGGTGGAFAIKTLTDTMKQALSSVVGEDYKISNRALFREFLLEIQSITEVEQSNKLLEFISL
jgi:hypothetical protein